MPSGEAGGQRRAGVRILLAELVDQGRTITPDDASGVVALAVAAELFPSEEVGIVRQMMADYFAVKAADGHACLVDERDGRLVAVAYYEPLTATDRTWELTMIGVDRDRHRQGLGARLLQAVEDDLKTRVRDYYEAGDDMIMFRKAL